MSSLARWSYTQSITIWPAATFDAYGQPSFGTPYLITGSWSVGGQAQTDDGGTEFVPQSTYYFEAVAGDSSIPSPQDYIKVGSHTGTASPIDAGAEMIRKVGGWDMGMFGSAEIPDWVIYTGMARVI